ncbi:hypothetical protein ABTF80_21805, partial [Acinetobacter baumannii]
MDISDRDSSVSRRIVVGGLAGAAALGATGARAQSPALPRSPITLNVIDVGGALALVQKPLDNFRAAKPNL